MADDGLSIVIPVYNEAAAVPGLLQRVDAIREKVSGPLEVILVNDGSTDGTVEGLSAASADYIQVIHHDSNRGYGAALKTGIQAAQYPWIAITDADATYPDERIPDLFEWTQCSGFDMVVGARVGRHVKIPLIRRPAKWCLSVLANWLSGHNIPDTNSGMRVMRKETLKLFVRVLPNGFSFTTTITLAMLSSGYRVKYVPIDYYHREGISKIRPFHDTLAFLQLICRTVLWFSPLRVFVPLGVFCMVLAFVVLIGSWQLMGKAWDISFAVLCMTGVMVITVGMLADLINKRIGH